MLAAVKQRYDPAGLFTVHHGVGSEGWSEDGFVPRVLPSSSPKPSHLRDVLIESWSA
jgi:hypothetical protein